MAGFVFKLESLLKVKEKLEEKAKTDYGKALLKLEKEKEILRELESRKIEAIDLFKNSIQKNIRSEEIKNINEFISLTDKKIKLQHKNIQETYEIAEEKRQNLMEAMKGKKIFEKLKEKEKENYMKEILQKEQKILDEIVSYKYNNG